MDQWDWAGAEQAVRNAQETEPRNVEVQIGVGSIASMTGRNAEAISAFQAAVRIDLLNQSAINSLGLAYLQARDLKNAESAFRQLLELNPDYPWGHANLGSAMLLAGRPQEALIEIRKNPDNFLRSVREKMALISIQTDDITKVAIDEFVRANALRVPFWIAEIEAWRGNTDAAFAALDLAFQQRSINLAFILGSPFFDSLEDDPRWAALLDRIGLLDAYVDMNKDVEGN
jgi:tetratricopeptide (TPR) repeat protein